MALQGKFTLQEYYFQRSTSASFWRGNQVDGLPRPLTFAEDTGPTKEENSDTNLKKYVVSYNSFRFCLEVSPGESFKESFGLS